MRTASALAAAGIALLAPSRAPAQPALLAPGVISTRDYERDATFTPDGRTFFFTKRTMWPGFSAICVSRLVRGRWSKPEIAPFSGQHPDAMPFVAPDGAALYFASRRPAGGGGERKGDFDLWAVDREDGGGWGAPRRLAVSTPANDVAPAVTRAGALYFVTGAEVPRVVRAQRGAAGWEAPAAVADPADRDGAELAAYVDPEERFMVVSIIGRDDALHSAEGLYGHADLYVRERHDGVWSRLRHLPAPINSAAEELAPGATPDGRTFLFTSERGVFTEHGTPFAYDAFERGLHAPGNGLGDIYQVPMRALGLP